MSAQIKVEDKLYQNRYIVDEGRPHIQIKDPKVCIGRCSSKPCTKLCPAGCYAADPDTGAVNLVTDGCLECGTCRIICQDEGNLSWTYPRGGYGISYKFG